MEKNVNNPWGHWWFRNPGKINVSAWRSNYAVLQEWNKDTDCVEAVVKKNIRGWVGPAASQQVPDNNCILAGGSEQIWIDSGDIRKIVDSPNYKKFNTMPIYKK